MNIILRICQFEKKTRINKLRETQITAEKSNNLTMPSGEATATYDNVCYPRELTVIFPESPGRNGPSQKGC